jgi:hypothetical protein
LVVHVLLSCFTLLIISIASREIAAHTDLEISPVLLFTSTEYEEHGRYTLLDHYTFKWRDGRMALALGLGKAAIFLVVHDFLFNSN